MRLTRGAQNAVPTISTWQRYVHRPAMIASSIFFAHERIQRCSKHFLSALAGAMLLVIATSNAHAVEEQEIDCESYLSGSTASPMTRQHILDLQKKLRANGYKHGSDDGVFGPQTLKALKRYCDDLRSRNARIPTHAVSYQLSGQDMESLLQTNELYAALDAVEPMADRNALVQVLETALKEMTGDKKIRPVEIIAKKVQTEGDAATTVYVVEQAYLNRLKKQVVHSKVIETIQAVQDVDYPTLDLFDNALVAQFNSDGQKKHKYEGKLKNRLQRLAEKPHPMDGLETLQWRSDGCGCVPEFTPKTTYGFYPYWLKGAEEDKAPVIDFSALSRIGCFTFYLDREGRLQEHDLWKSNSHQAGFIKKAHKYRTKTDVVIHIPDWFVWYETVTHNEGGMILELAGLVITAPKADGITLFLGAYPDNPDHLGAFKQFLDKLRTRLEKAGRPFALNLMLPAILKQNEEIVERFLVTIFPDAPEALDTDDQEKAPDTVDLLLVFLDQPTSYWKKEMRYIIEKQFKGVRRKNIQRKILPIVMAPADAGDQQFIDDLIYFEDNFGGVGFWPIPNGEEKNRRRLSEEVSSVFVDPERTALMQRMWAKPSKLFCRFICPNRDMLKIVFLSVFIFMALWAIVSCWVCEMRGIYRRFSWYFLALILIDILLLFSLLTCDPAWVGYSTEIFVGVLISMAFYMVFRQLGKVKEADYP